MRRKQKMARVCVAAAVTGGVLVGLAGPAVAEGHFNSSLVGWNVGKESRQWINYDLDDTDDRATFSYCDQDGFRITIYKEDAGPDTNVGSETLQCQGSTKDAVRAGDVGRDEYHFTLKSGSNIDAKVTVYW